MTAAEIRHHGLARIRWVRALRARPRLFVSAVLGIAIFALLPDALAGHLSARFLVAWNAMAGMYLLLAALMMLRSTPQAMRLRAQTQDEGAGMILVLVVASAIACLVAIAGQLAVVKNLHGFIKTAHIALAGLTVVLSWAFIQVMFALHYAHDYYAAAARGQPVGLAFPGDDAPVYGDFFYFAAVIGTSGQTADIAFVSKSMRRIGSVHCILSYLFNTTVLALLINIGASLF